MQINSAQDLFVNQLRDIHSAEKQLSRALPRLSKAARSDKVREGLDERLEHGRELLDSIDEIMEEMSLSKGRQKNQAIEGLIEDARELTDEIKDDKVLDAALIAGVQKIEHYCIAAWGTVAAMGRAMGQKKVVEAFENALDQGKRFDKKLTDIAEKEINPAMMDGGKSEAIGGRQQGRDKDEMQGSAAHQQKKGQAEQHKGK